MNPAITELVRDTESRYLTKSEMDTVLSFTNSVPTRFKASQEVEKKEDAIVAWVIEEMKSRYPQFQKFHAQAWDKGYRDVQLVLRHSVQAMVWDDPAMQEEKLLHWFATILASFNFTPKFNRDCYVLLRDGVKKNVAAGTYKLLEPFLNKNIEILGSIAEPAVAMV